MSEQQQQQQHDHGRPAAAADAPPSDIDRLATALSVRASDIEPYVGLRYLSKLFRIMAILMLLLLVAETVTGLMQGGSAVLPTLLSVAARLLVFAAALWGAGDLAILVIDLGHDVRATRILLARAETRQRGLAPEPAAHRRSVDP